MRYGNYVGLRAVCGGVFRGGVFWVGWGGVADYAGGAVGGGFEVLGGVREDEGLACEGAEAGEAVVAGAGKGVVGVVGGDVAETGDEGEVVDWVVGGGFKPALDEFAGLVWRAELAGDVALSGARDEADDDGGVAVDDAKVGFVFGKVAVGDRRRWRGRRRGNDPVRARSGAGGRSWRVWWRRR